MCFVTNISSPKYLQALKYILAAGEVERVTLSSPIFMML